MSDWPDDIDVNQRRAFIDTRLEIGAAICPRCLKAHVEAGREHLKQPWSVTPLCTDCGEPLKLPEWPPYRGED